MRCPCPTHTRCIAISVIRRHLHTQFGSPAGPSSLPASTPPYPAPPPNWPFYVLRLPSHRPKPLWPDPAPLRPTAPFQLAAGAPSNPPTELNPTPPHPVAPEPSHAPPRRSGTLSRPTPSLQNPLTPRTVAPEPSHTPPRRSGTLSRPTAGGSDAVNLNGTVLRLMVSGLWVNDKNPHVRAGRDLTCHFSRQLLHSKVRRGGCARS